MHGCYNTHCLRHDGRTERHGPLERPPACRPSIEGWCAGARLVGRVVTPPPSPPTAHTHSCKWCRPVLLAGGPPTTTHPRGPPQRCHAMCGGAGRMVVCSHRSEVARCAPSCGGHGLRRMRSHCGVCVCGGALAGGGEGHPCRSPQAPGAAMVAGMCVSAAWTCGAAHGVAAHRNDGQLAPAV